ncbi:hypothetical protein PoB_006956400 [Plakobranchus ocellatus]|uniref:Uncharacterized protein n=1 Tax=Plakobranchus ocellatus TaxID=259542 RepID=A0AAV4DFW6_9GAST|nr:hypothetical protein PoB_006956400 [Plakobranchus ocellatus]
MGAKAYGRGMKSLGIESPSLVMIGAPGQYHVTFHVSAVSGGWTGQVSGVFLVNVGKNEITNRPLKPFLCW